jgi:fatty-acid desaturase
MTLSIKVTRKSNFLGMLGGITLYVDGQKETKIRNGKTHEFEPLNQTVELKVKQAGSGSNTIKADNFSAITIAVNPLFINLYLIGVISLFFGAVVAIYFYFIAAAIFIAASVVGFSRNFILSKDSTDISELT